MRKRTEAQPPSLPDLTREAAGSVSNINNSSKGSSSVNNFKDISVNGEDSSLSDQRLRSLFGVQNGLLADVVHVLLEYAHLILGPQFSSLAQLAQYLVINRYVNSRSKHAFALIAFAENQSSSPSIPSTHDLASSLFDVLQRGGKSQTSGNSDNIGSLPLLPNPEVRTRTQIVSKISGQSNTPNSTIPYSSGTPDRLSQTSNSTRTSTPKASDAQTFHGSPLTTCNNALGKVNPVSNPTVDPVVPHMINTSSHNPVESTYSGTSAVTAAAVAASVLTGYSAALAGYPGYYPTQSPYSKQSTNSAQIRSQMPPSSETENAQDSSAAVALAAAAYAVHQHQLTSTNSNAPNAPLASPMIAYNRTQQSFTRQISPVNAGKTSTLATTFHSYSGESSASLGHRYNATLSPISVGQQTFGSYTAPLSAHSVLHPNFPSAGTLSSSPRLASPVDYCIPAPAHPPLGAGLGSAMSPYTPARGAQTSAISSVDVTSSTKRFTPPPIDAPGAYEPSPRFHLGGSSPNKRPRYFHGHPASVSTAQNIDIYDLPVPTSSFTTKSNAISVSSLEYNGSKTPEVRLPNRGASFYSGGYEGLGMFSPAPAPSSQSHLSTSPLSVLPVSSLTPSLPHVSSSTQPSWSQFSSRQEDSSWKVRVRIGCNNSLSLLLVLILTFKTPIVDISS
ncbi:unnamed protein product [Protopolystoma xenopodis]|uniref:Uncharacterized protein n=1 Tax=Protopolystoma xenopodis TaxID=117903 RepID=A0A3S5A1K1_9PLAT|nr:unnamed protein product [Protopolystoma xenopodis]